MTAPLKARDLKPLSDDQLLLLGARVALRVAAWCPAGARATWDRAMELLLVAGGGGQVSARTVQASARTLRRQGTLGAYGTAPEVIASARGSAGSALACALEATLLPARKDRWKRVVVAGKHAGSVYARLAHGGRMALDPALAMYWSAVGADVASIAGGTSPTTLDALAALGPLWPEGTPDWAAPD